MLASGGRILRIPELTHRPVALLCHHSQRRGAGGRTPGGRIPSSPARPPVAVVASSPQALVHVEQEAIHRYHLVEDHEAGQLELPSLLDRLPGAR
jgi:hypothetical protein